MRHKIIDLAEDLNQLYMRLDLLPKKIIIHQNSKRIINNHELLVKQIARMKQKNKCTDLDQEEISQLFVQTFEIGELGRAEPISCQVPKLGLTFGVQFCKLDQHPSLE
jgi:hypothetical protein